MANQGLAFLPALPSDYILLLRDRTKYQYKWLEHGSPVPAGHIFGVSEALCRPIAEVCDRLRLLGYIVPDEAILLNDKILASNNLDGKAPWRTPPQLHRRR